MFTKCGYIEHIGQGVHCQFVKLGFGKETLVGNIVVFGNTITFICILKACSSTWTLYRGKIQKMLKGLPVWVVASKNALS